VLMLALTPALRKADAPRHEEPIRPRFSLA
jgi:hypothetical protein